MQPNQKGALEYIQGQLDDDSLFSIRNTTEYVHGLELSNVITTTVSEMLLEKLKNKCEKWNVSLPKKGKI